MDMEKTAKRSSAPWSVPVVAEDIPETGRHIEIEAPAEVRAALSKLAGLNDLTQLKAVFDLTKRGSGVHVAGQVSARVGQTCVVTLEPIENQVAEAIDLSFVPGAKVPKTPEDPEPLIGGRLDLGAIATEFFLLGIDPYPRKADAKFTPPAGSDDGAHPFSALEALKKPPGGGQT